MAAGEPLRCGELPRDILDILDILVILVIPPVVVLVVLRDIIGVPPVVVFAKPSCRTVTCGLPALS